MATDPHIDQFINAMSSVYAAERVRADVLGGCSRGRYIPRHFVSTYFDAPCPHLLVGIRDDDLLDFASRYGVADVWESDLSVRDGIALAVEKIAPNSSIYPVYEERLLLMLEIPMDFIGYDGIPNYLQHVNKTLHDIFRIACEARTCRRLSAMLPEEEI